MLRRNNIFLAIHKKYDTIQVLIFCMSETTDSTSLQGLHSVAERLKAAGFRQTGIARAVTELV